jgi:RecJ-like exonuclease
VTCRCVSCSSCEGTGNVWLDFRGKYLGNHRSDDMDELVRCEDCEGSGISEECDECADRYMDEDANREMFGSEAQYLGKSG